MFIRDGIVYGGEPERPIRAEQVKILPDMMITAYTSTLI